MYFPVIQSGLTARTENGSKRKPVEEIDGAGGHSDWKEAKLIKTDAPSSSSPELREPDKDVPSSFPALILKKTWITDSEHLLQIFPEEVWLLILEDISDRDTLESLYNASQFFRALLLPRRTRFLFPKVWTVLGKKYHKHQYRDVISCYRETPDSDPSDSEDEGRSWKVTPRKLKYNKWWFSGIIKLRLVCRTWCVALDVSSTSSLFQKTVDHNYHDRSLTFPRHFQLTHIGTDGVAIRNPFVGRSISIKFAAAPEHGHTISTPFIARMISILSKYGHFISDCDLFLQDTFSSRVECYWTTKALLELMPNLNTLHFRCFRPENPADYSKPTTSPEEFARLQEFINTNPLPTFGNLTLLKIGVSYMNSPFLQEIFRSNGQQIDNIGISRHSCTDEHDISTGTIPNLKDPSLRFHSEVDFEDFARRDIKWQLVKLSLAFGRPTVLEWGRLFQVIEDNWRNTLQQLEIQLPITHGVEAQNLLLENCGNLRLNMPHVKSLRLRLENLSCLDLLLPMKDNLEALDLLISVTIQQESHLGYLNTIENGKEIKLLSFAERPLESNIWTLFPKLKRIAFYQGVQTCGERLKHVDFTPKVIKWSQNRQDLNKTNV